jgi:hypothetical protein
MIRQVVLTVSESKRLIAKAIKQLPQVQTAMKKGLVVVPTGTTNAYVLQELWGKAFDLRRYRSGITVPKTPEKKKEKQEPPIPDVVFKDGEVDPKLDRFNAVKDMKSGDIYIKGANALDYNKRTAGVLIGDLKGGTVGGVLGHLIGKKIELIIPIGLEKLIYGNINDLHLLASQPDSQGPSLWPITGTIITEIEALKTLTGVDSVLYSAGGVAGAEGSVRLLVKGSEEKVKKTMNLVSSIKDEPKYLL